MEAFKCDRCGQYYDRFHTGSDFVVTIANRLNAVRDLCPDCHKTLNNWMEEFENEKEVKNG